MHNRQHLKETIVLSGPLIVSQVGHIITGMVDTIFLGNIGKTEQAAGIFANNIFLLLLVFSIGLSYSITPLVSEANAQNNNEKKASLFVNGAVLNIAVSILLFILLFISSPLLTLLGQPHDVVQLSIPFFNVLALSIIPVSLFFIGKQFTEGLSNTKIAMVISIIGNLLNILLNYLLINGIFGLPKMGYMGSCWATFIARVFMGILFMIIILQHSWFKALKPYFKRARILKSDLLSLFKLGVNSGFQFLVEVAAFSCLGMMVGWIGKEEIDAHGIALSLASFTYMFSSGISGAASIRVSHFAATSDSINIKKAGISALLITTIFMSTMAILFLILHTTLPKLFSTDKEIIKLSGDLLCIAALFQLFDGIQVTSLGILRGVQEMRFPTLVTLIGYWIIALPLAYFLGFTLNLGVIGIWSAISTGLAIVAILLTLRFRKIILQD